MGAANLKTLQKKFWLIEMLRQKKLALINDVTGFGRCSVTVELPIISALKIQVCPLPAIKCAYGLSKLFYGRLH